MKRFFQKTLSLILSLVLLISAVVFLPSAAADDAPGTDVPLIYVVGTGSGLYKNDENGNVQQVYPITVPDGFVENTVKENIGVFAKAVITQDWTDFGVVMHDVLGELYGSLALDENAQIKDGSYCGSEWTRRWINPNTVNGKYPTTQYSFYYDFRLDPFETAKSLHSYIEKVMSVTGADHVALLGRCLGGCITAAYMKLYDGEYISDYIQYCTALKGANPCSKLFAGDVYLDADAIERFFYDYKIFTDDFMNELLQSFLTVFNATYGLDLACWAVNNVWEDIYLDIMPDMLLETFGTWPGYWSMVSDEDYERAKDNIFHNADMEKWSSFIDIIDNYHYNVQNEVEKDFVRYTEMGIDIYNVSKYGFQTVPVSAPGDIMSDSTCDLDKMSLGATASTLTSVLSDEYLAQAKANGTYNYISPDHQVDASTCLFPNKTWFLKNLTHADFPDVVNSLFDNMVNKEDYTVNSDENYPQFMIYLDGAIIPTTENNSNTTEKYNVTFWDALKILINHLNKIITDLIKSRTTSPQLH